MKIYLIRNEFDNGNGEIENTVTAYAAKQLAEQAIKTMIDDEINMLINDGTLARNDDGTIEFANFVGDSFIEVTDTKLCLRNDWNFTDNIWIEEKELIMEA